MKKIFIILVVLIVLILAAGYTLFKPPFYKTETGGKGPASFKGATYIIDGRSVTLANGASEIEAVPGSASKIMTRYFGNEVRHDFDGDGREDVAFLLTQQTGGSGTFYYIVAALNTEGGFVGSQAFLLGDRIAPQTTEMSRNPKQKNVVIVNYADRAKDESFAVWPSVGKSVWLLLDVKTMKLNDVGQNFEE